MLVGAVVGRVGGADGLPARLDSGVRRVDVCRGGSELTTAAPPVVVAWVCMLARNATATTAVVTTVISNLIPRLTRALPSP